jgi:hypothetical protein
VFAKKQEDGFLAEDGGGRERERERERERTMPKRGNSIPGILFVSSVKFLSL